MQKTIEGNIKKKINRFFQSKTSDGTVEKSWERERIRMGRREEKNIRLVWKIYRKV